VPDTNDATALSAQPPDQTYTRIQNQVGLPNREEPAWGLGGALLVWFLSIFLVVVLPVLLVIPYLISKGFNFSNSESARAAFEFALSDKTALIIQVAAILPCHLITLFMVWVLVTRFRRRLFWSTIDHGPRGLFLKDTLYWTGLAVLLVIVGSVIVHFLGDGKPTPLEQVIKSSLAARYLISFFAVATAPLVEEFVYRGILFVPLQKWLGTGAAAGIVLAIFTVIHIPQYLPNAGVITVIALLSVVLTVVRARTGRLMPCIIIHFVFNGIQAVLLVLEPYLEKFVTTPEPVAPPAIAMWPLLAALI
jgi:membrane protease YdiL (CAAX protease family)